MTFAWCELYVLQLLDRLVTEMVWVPHCRQPIGTNIWLSLNYAGLGSWLGHTCANNDTYTGDLLMSE
jgi:hypothetical protein